MGTTSSIAPPVPTTNRPTASSLPVVRSRSTATATTRPPPAATPRNVSHAAASAASTRTTVGVPSAATSAQVSSWATSSTPTAPASRTMTSRTVAGRRPKPTSPRAPADVVAAATACSSWAVSVPAGSRTGPSPGRRSVPARSTAPRSANGPRHSAWTERPHTSGRSHERRNDGSAPGGRPVVTERVRPSPVSHRCTVTPRAPDAATHHRAPSGTSRARSTSRSSGTAASGAGLARTNAQSSASARRHSRSSTASRRSTSASSRPVAETTSRWTAGRRPRRASTPAARRGSRSSRPRCESPTSSRSSTARATSSETTCAPGTPEAVGVPGGAGSGHRHVPPRACTTRTTASRRHRSSFVPPRVPALRARSTSMPANPAPAT